jgi:hypothetical protein
VEVVAHNTSVPRNKPAVCCNTQEADNNSEVLLNIQLRHQQLLDLSNVRHAIPRDRLYHAMLLPVSLLPTPAPLPLKEQTLFSFYPPDFLPSFEGLFPYFSHFHGSILYTQIKKMSSER